MAFLSLVALLVAFGALSKAGRLGGELKILRREVDWLRSDRIRRSGREDAGDAVREVALDAPVPEPEPVDPATPGLGPFSDLVGAELRWRAPPGSSAPFKTGPGIPPPEPPSEEGPDAEGAVTQEAVPEEKAQEEPVAVARDWRLGKKPTPTIGSIPQPTVDQKKGAAADLEARIGGTWLLRIGLVSLAIALALFASSVVPDLSPGAKVALAYAGALAFFGIGKFFAARLEKFARPVMAGGLAFGFFVAFAAHFVPAMQVVSLPVSIVWMVVSMITVLIAAERWQSQPTAGLAIILGQISAFVSAGDAGAYSLVMIGLLALTAVILLLRHRWVALGVFAVAASYGSHLLWIFAERDPIPGIKGSGPTGELFSNLLLCLRLSGRRYAVDHFGYTKRTGRCGRDWPHDGRLDVRLRVVQHRPTWGAKHAGQWAATLRTYAYPKIGEKRVDWITTADVMGVLLPLWQLLRAP